MALPTTTAQAPASSALRASSGVRMRPSAITGTERAAERRSTRQGLGPQAPASGRVSGEGGCDAVEPGVLRGETLFKGGDVCHGGKPQLDMDVVRKLSCRPGVARRIGRTGTLSAFHSYHAAAGYSHLGSVFGG
jgi:hypothetical protein